jgi:probable F420-dependent oxidoreductase
MTIHPFRFGVATNAGTSAADIKERARKLEDLGYYSLLWQDHYIGPGTALVAAQHPAQAVAAIPAAMIAMDATTTLTVGFRVLCVDYHHPVVLAKELATLDCLSNGRLEIGLGAGWMSSEYAAMGIPFDSAGRRIERLAEAITVIDQCLTGRSVDFQGTYYSVQDFQAVPAPSQRPRPPIAIGGGGPKILALAARRADIVSLNLDMRSGKFGADAIGRSSEDAISEKLEWIRTAAGPRYPNLIVEVGAHFAAVTDNADDVLESMTRLPAHEARQHPHALVGSVDEICDLLHERRDRYGFSYITIQERVAEAFAPVAQRLAGQ